MAKTQAAKKSAAAPTSKAPGKKAQAVAPLKKAAPRKKSAAAPAAKAAAPRKKVTVLRKKAAAPLRKKAAAPLRKKAAAPLRKKAAAAQDAGALKRPKLGMYVEMLYEIDAELSLSDMVRPPMMLEAQAQKGLFTPLDSSHLSLAELRATRDKCRAERTKHVHALKDFVRSFGPKAVPVGNLSTAAWVAAHAEADARAAISARVGLGHPDYCTCSPTGYNDFFDKSLKVLLAPCRSSGGPCP